MDASTPPRGRGRPKTRPDDLVKLRLDVTPEELEMIRSACETLNVSQASFARQAVVEAAQKVTAPAPTPAKAKKPGGKRP